MGPGRRHRALLLAEDALPPFPPTHTRKDVPMAFPAQRTAPLGLLALAASAAVLGGGYLWLHTDAPARLMIAVPCPAMMSGWS